MADLYALILRLADRCLRRQGLCLAAIAVVAFVVLSSVALFVLRDFPNSGDEYAYLYEAQTLALGRVWNPARPGQEYFETNYIFVRDEKVFSVFPPGWPLVLAGAYRLGVPSWSVNPLLGALSLLILFWLGRTLYGARVALIAVGVTLMSPFYLFTSASYFSHTLCALLVLAATCFTVRVVSGGAVAQVLLVGALLGGAVLTRYYTAVLCAIPIGVLLCSRPRRLPASLAWLALGGAPFAAFLLFYNRALTGNPWSLSLSGVDLYFSRWFARNWFFRGIDMLASHLWSFLLWTPPALLVAYAYYLRRDFPGWRHRLIQFTFLCLVVGMFPYTDRGGNQYGPRYYFEGFPLLVLFTCAGLFGETSWGEKTRAGQRVFAWVAVSVAAIVPLLAWHAWTERKVILQRQDVYRQVDAGGLTNAIVLLEGRVGATRSMSVLDLTRNGPEMTGTVLYAVDRGDGNQRLIELYPGWTFYRYRYDSSSHAGRLELVPPSRQDR